MCQFLLLIRVSLDLQQYGLDLWRCVRFFFGLDLWQFRKMKNGASAGAKADSCTEPKAKVIAMSSPLLLKLLKLLKWLDTLKVVEISLACIFINYLFTRAK